MKKQSKHPEDMNAAELAGATEEFDRPFVFEKGRAMTNVERAQERQTATGPGPAKDRQGGEKDQHFAGAAVASSNR